jgi:hypothetical protein
MFPNVELVNEVRAHVTAEQNKERFVRYNATEKRRVVRNRFYETEKGKACRLRDKEMVKCACGCTVQRRHLPKHKRSKAHKKWQVLQEST